jgi:8-oxo-dGTP pyrophosphatase MutT (NUDIX family)
VFIYKYMSCQLILDDAQRDNVELVFVDPIIIHNGGILNIHRRKDAKKYPDCWCLPGGGVDPGEDPETAVRREALEELGVEVIAANLVTKNGEPFYWNSISPKDTGGIWRGVYFIVTIKGEPQLMEHDKHDGIEYVTKESLQEFYPGSISDSYSPDYRGELEVWDLVDLSFESLAIKV